MVSAFRASGPGWIALVRAGAGATVIFLGNASYLLPAGIGLVLCVWLDVAGVWLARRKGWTRGPAEPHLEGFADLLCFVVAPAVFALELGIGILGWPFVLAFVCSGVWRIARFNVEGFQDGRYVGLPVTYNGYIFPALGLLIHFAGLPSLPVLAPALVVLAMLMTSRKLKIPEL